MAVKIRLARLGCKNRAFYRIVAADSHTPRDGKHLQVLGFYDPLAAKGDARRLGLNVDLVKYWLSVGAQPTDTVRGILMRAGLISPPPMVVMGQKKGPSGDTSNPEKMITQFLYEKPVVSITEHILECTLEILSCLLLVYTSNKALNIRTYDRHKIRDSLCHGLNAIGIHFNLKVGNGHVYCVSRLLSVTLADFWIEIHGSSSELLWFSEGKEAGDWVWKDLVSRIFNSTKGMQLGAPYKEIKINYDLGQFKRFRHAKYGAVLRESLSAPFSRHWLPAGAQASDPARHVLVTCEGWSTAPTTIGGYGDA
ncbi:hypothetical protein H0E87_022753 [Populus deltoides]|nr:hypothetical protein H0E87_022753 [Populus deltoides]